MARLGPHNCQILKGAEFVKKNSSKPRMTNKRAKRRGPPMSQEDLEFAYHDNVIAFPSEGPMPLPKAGSELDHRWHVDALGRVNGKTYPEQDDEARYASISSDLDDEIPDFMKESAVKKPPENPQEHKVPDPLKAVKTRNVQLIKDTTLEYPLLGFSVFVQPDPDVANDEARFAKIFARSYCKRALSVLEADLVVFGGGSDICPSLYGDERHEATYYNTERDKTDIALYNFCLENGIPMFGVCRGAQFGHVMNKGRLFQDVDRHYGDHPMWDVHKGKHLEKISSVHHQMVMPNNQNGMQILATSARSNVRESVSPTGSLVKEYGTNADIEAFFYRNSGFIGVQGHPEYDGYHYYTVWCLELIKELIYESCDFEWIGNNLRMKPELVAERAMLANLPKLTLSASGKENN
jgi:gamma-glutamyl-gamma-aminobutyrate hydrolase PuuD